MDFLKRHYEKVILLGLFVLFIALMFMVQGIIGRTQEISEKDLQLPKREADHEMVNDKDKMFDPEYMWKDTKLVWNDGASRDPQSNIAGFSDLVHVFPIAICPYCNDPLKSDNIKLIPLDNFSSKDVKRSCPVCHHELPAPQERKKMYVGIKSEQDRDGDGIPNDLEQKYSLNPDDPSDALYDNDNDGFSNYIEIANGFDPTNPASHPPYWWRLRLKDVKQIELPIKFMAITDNGVTDKKQWDLQFNTPHRRIKGKVVSLFCRIGESVEIESREYRIDDVVRQFEQVKVEGNLGGGEATRTQDKTKVFLTEVIHEGGSARQPDKLTMTIAQPAYSSDKRPVLEDVGYPEGMEYALRINDIVYVGGIGVENLRRDRTAGRYQLKEVDVEKRIVKIVDLGVRPDENGERPRIEITAEGKIPSSARAVARKDRGRDEMDGAGFR
ncbi:MAG: hypothetical protein MR051_01500 [Lentisphaeria bacterium]|nr:hypothetical protein [Lentisphaeria bacterium]